MNRTAVFSAIHLARHMTDFRSIRPLEAQPFNYYALAEEAIRGFFAGGCNPVALSLSNLGRLLAEASTPQASIRIQDNIRAVVAFDSLFRGMARQGYTLIPLAAKDKPLTVGGLKLDVRPLAAIQRRREDGTLEVGLLKIHFSKTEALGVAPARFLRSLMRTWAQRRLARLGAVRSMIVLMDVFDMTVYRESTGFTCPHIMEQGCQGFAMMGRLHQGWGEVASR